MRWKKGEVYILTFLLFIVAAVFGTREPWDRPAFSFEAVTEAGTETIQIWNRGDGEGFVFLPSYVSLDQLRIHTSRPVWMGEHKLTYGQTLENLELDRAYALSGAKGLTSVTFMKSQGLPTVYIDTASGNMEEIHTSKAVAEQGTMRLYSAAGDRLFLGNLNSIKMRGNSTVGAAKKPYNLTLSREENLLDMGAAANWILLANAFDETNLRNKIVYDFAQQAGLPYSPQSQWVDLYLNGEYAGLYQLCERNEVHPERVAISEAGSFLVSMDFVESLTEQNIPFIETDEAQFGLRVRYTDVEEETIREIWRSAAAAASAEDGIDPITGKHYLELIDLDSWVRRYLIEEIFANVDGGRASQFYYMDGADPVQKLYAGPVWDYDRALFNPCVYWEFGAMTHVDETVNTFYVNCNPASSYFHLYQNPDFYSRMTVIYERDFLPLLKKLTQEEFSTYTEQIKAASEMNAIRWNILDAEEQTKTLRNRIEERTAFLSSVWLDNREYVTVLAGFDDRNVAYALNPGENLSQLPQFEDRSWRVHGTDILVDATQPVYGDMNIQLHYD